MKDLLTERARHKSPEASPAPVQPHRRFPGFQLSSLPLPTPSPERGEEALAHINSLVESTDPSPQSSDGVLQNTCEAEDPPSCAPSPRISIELPANHSIAFNKGRNGRYKPIGAGPDWSSRTSCDIEETIIIHTGDGDSIMLISPKEPRPARRQRKPKDLHLSPRSRKSKTNRFASTEPCQSSAQISHMNLDQVPSFHSPGLRITAIDPKELLPSPRMAPCLPPVAPSLGGGGFVGGKEPSSKHRLPHSAPQRGEEEPSYQQTPHSSKLRPLSGPRRLATLNPPTSLEARARVQRQLEAAMLAGSRRARNASITSERSKRMLALQQPGSVYATQHQQVHSLPISTYGLPETRGNCCLTMLNTSEAAAVASSRRVKAPKAAARHAWRLEAGGHSGYKK